jgi:hypothetical protein
MCEFFPVSGACPEKQGKLMRAFLSGISGPEEAARQGARQLEPSKGSQMKTVPV